MMNYSKTVVVIPAYDPNERMIKLLQELRHRTSYDIVVINDGSKKETFDIFEEAKNYADVMNHDVNKGKGEAIKTALKFIYQNYKEDTGIVVADCDGQHTIEDIIKVINKLDLNNDNLILGSREFHGDVPFRSKFGNTLTKYVFYASSRVKVNDTQTGLRAFNYDMIPFLLDVNGSRYEYEMNVLLECAKNKIEILEVQIETIYLEDNKSSHFNPTLDSLRIYKGIIKFSCSSLVSFFIDFFVYSLMIVCTGSLSVGISVLISNVVARIISSSVNFHINRKYVFKDNDSISKSAVRYFGLVVFILLMNTALLSLLTETIFTSKIAAKIVVEILLFTVSLTVQRLFVFKGANLGRSKNEHIKV